MRSCHNPALFNLDVFSNLKSRYIFEKKNTGEAMVFHSKDGSEFVGLRERGGTCQIVYDQHKGRRVVLTLEQAQPDRGALTEVLRGAAQSRNVLSAVVAELAARRIAVAFGPS